MATTISRGLVGSRNTDSIGKVKTFVASSTSSSGIMRSAKSGNFSTDSICIEVPEVRASFTSLIIPVPDLASYHGWSLIIGRREDTASVYEVIAFVASSAGTSSIMSSARITNRNADIV